MKLSDKQKAAIKTAVIALVAGFIGNYAEPVSKVVDFLFSLF